jgi:hypothetical protein
MMMLAEMITNKKSTSKKTDHHKKSIRHAKGEALTRK